MSEISQRPWGSFEVLQESSLHKVKSITVNPGMRLSYQKHQFRAEHWFIVEGTAEVTINDSVTILSPGQSIQFPTETWHRVANPGVDRLLFIEVQTGISFDEADIERKDDDFGRAE
jgi:mannose-6-phosphate isomerase-like protein (cupin superfamily)